MLRPMLMLGAAIALCGLVMAQESKSTNSSIYEFTVKDIDGKDVTLAKYKGDVLLIVNVASQCGLTANNFGGQEPGTNAEIKTFCQQHSVTFDLFDKISVKGKDEAPLYAFLTKHPDKAIAGDVQWNFQKYLIGRDGTVLAKFTPTTYPEDKHITDAIEKALEAKGATRD